MKTREMHNKLEIYNFSRGLKLAEDLWQLKVLLKTKIGVRSPHIPTRGNRPPIAISIRRKKILAEQHSHNAHRSKISGTILRLKKTLKFRENREPEQSKGSNLDKISFIRNRVFL